jgi:hypothetical protein
VSNKGTTTFSCHKEDGSSVDRNLPQVLAAAVFLRLPPPAVALLLQNLQQKHHRATAQELQHGKGQSWEAAFGSSIFSVMTVMMVHHNHH